MPRGDLCNNGDGRKAVRLLNKAGQPTLCRRCFDARPESERLRRPGMARVDLRVPAEHASRVRRLGKALRDGATWANAAREE